MVAAVVTAGVVVQQSHFNTLFSIPTSNEEVCRIGLLYNMVGCQVMKILKIVRTTFPIDINIRN